MTTEQSRAFYRNRYHAWKYFVEQGIIPKDAEPYTYAMHHKDEQLKYTDIERYIQWNIEDLEVIPFGEHSKHHNSCPKKEETKLKMSQSHKGKNTWSKGENNPMHGKHPIPWNKGKTGFYSEEYRKKISEAHKGKSMGSPSEETRKKISEAKKAYWAKKKQLQETTQCTQQTKN